MKREIAEVSIIGFTFFLIGYAVWYNTQTTYTGYDGTITDARSVPLSFPLNGYYHEVVTINLQPGNKNVTMVYANICNSHFLPNGSYVLVREEQQLYRQPTYQISYNYSKIC